MKLERLFNRSLLFVVLLAFWVIMSGHYDALHIGQGVLCSALVLYLNYRLKSHRFFEESLQDFRNFRFLRLGYYVPWLIVQIIQSGFHVAYVILNPRRQTQPRMLKFKTDLPNAQAKVILGNSITLTPGTLTVDIEEDEFTVHALTLQSCEGIVNDSMPRQVRKLFSSEDREVVSEVRFVDSEGASE